MFKVEANFIGSRIRMLIARFFSLGQAVKCQIFHVIFGIVFLLCCVIFCSAVERKSLPHNFFALHEFERPELRVSHNFLFFCLQSLWGTRIHGFTCVSNFFTLSVFSLSKPLREDPNRWFHACFVTQINTWMGESSSRSWHSRLWKPHLPKAVPKLV